MTYHDDYRNALSRDLIALIDADARGEIHLPRTVEERVLEEAVIEAAQAHARGGRRFPPRREYRAFRESLAALTAYRERGK